MPESGTAVPELDRVAGITLYSTHSPGIGGRIRSTPEDFEVDEVLSERAAGSIRERGRYAVYSLTKRNIDTGHCLVDIHRRGRIRLKALGLKDASACTTQYVCATSAGAGMPRLQTGRYDLVRLGYVDKPLTKRAMIGNRFGIVIRGCAGDPGAFEGYGGILNHYGYQRFGSRRPVTHLVGKAIIRRDFEEAVRLILSATSPFDTDANNNLRRRLADPANHAECLEVMPRSMDTERAVIRSLADGGDARSAILAVPLYLRRLYVQAYQSYVFNRTLGAAALDGQQMSSPQDRDICFDGAGRIGKYEGGPDQRLAVPIVGYSYYKKTRFHPVISEILSREDVAPRDFYIKEMQEVSAEGGFRQAVLECTGYETRGCRVMFVLSRGSFATMVLREIIKPADPVAAGF